MIKKPYISVVIPVKQLTYNLLYENLPSFSNQIYKNFEVLVLPNEHSQYDLTLLKKYHWLRIIPTGTITRPAEKRDIGANHAKGEILAFIDDDAYPETRWLNFAANLFKRNKIASACGPGILPTQTSLWEKIFDEVLKTAIGSGEYNYRFIPKSKRYVLDYPSMNFFIRKNIFKKIGGFNSDYWPGEDSKLCNDLIEKEKGKILYDPRLLVFHHRRKDFQGFIYQHMQYGFHRGAFFAHGDKNSRQATYLLPSIFIVYLFGLIIIHPVYAFVPLVLYCILLSYLFIKSFINTRNLIISFGTIIVLTSMHLSYGWMFIKGFLKGRNKKKSIYA